MADNLIVVVRAVVGAFAEVAGKKMQHLVLVEIHRAAPALAFLVVDIIVAALTVGRSHDLGPP